MRTSFRLLTRCLVLGLLLLGSCAKYEEQPAPNVSQSKSENIQLLKQLFLDKGYGQQLFSPLKDQKKTYWTPRWDQASQRTTSEPATYVYVPLEAPAVAWVGVKKYLFIKRAGNQLDFSEGTYLFEDKENISWTPANARAFFAAFTGTLLLKDLATGEGSHLVYKNGTRQPRQPTQSAKSSSTGGASNLTSSCYTAVTCYWSGYCSSENTSSGGGTVGTVTTGIDYCESPADNGIGCSSIIWYPTGSNSQEFCNSDPSDPGNPGGGGDGGNGDGGNGDNDPNSSLENKLEINRTALFGPCPGLTDAWKPLIIFQPLREVINRLNNLTNYQLGIVKMMTPYSSVDPRWQIQAIEYAQGTAVNLDRFSVTMTQLPTVNGVQLNAPQFMEYIRTHINDFVGPGQPTFAPQNILPGEDTRWQNHELGTIVSINIPLDNGSVILSDYSRDELDTHWTFSTLHDPYNGSHPVSGTRSFGIVTVPGSSWINFTQPTTYTFYIQGADRILSRPGEMAGALMSLSTNPANAFQYKKGDEAWNSLANGVANFVNNPSHGGHTGAATVSAPITNRPNWTDVYNALQNHQPLSSVPCN